MTTASEMVEKYLAAELDLLAGKEVSFNGRSLKMENLQEIRAGRLEWEGRVSREIAIKSGDKNSIGGRGFALARLDSDR
ncbi:MAG: hypothetical protein ACAH12_03550 [Methylophilaceae bacterium]